MATKVKPSRLQITGTPQAWNVPVYVDQDTFQWWAWWWGGWDVKVFKLQWTTDYTTADDARDAYMLWEPVIVMLGTDAFRFTSDTVLYWDIPMVFSASWITTKMMVLTLDWNNKITNIQVTNMSFSWPTVVDNLTTQSATSALSANQWYVLKTLVDNLTSRGRFLSLWNSATGLAISTPQSIPYNYQTWDYFIVSVVSSATPAVNYRPDGSSYTGTASAVVETNDVEVWDTYAYDGTNWLFQSNHWKTVTFSSIVWDPYDNTNLANALADKQDELVSGTNIRTINWTSILWSWDITTPVWWDVYWPSSSTDWHLALFDGATGKLLKDGWAVPTGVPSWWTNWQVLTNVNGTPTWANPTWWISVSPNSTITGIKYIWYGTEADYANLSQYYTDQPWDTEFHTF